MNTEELKEKMTIQNALDFLCDSCHHGTCDKNRRICNEGALERLKQRGWFEEMFIKQSKDIYNRMIENNSSGITSDQVRIMMNAIEHLESKMRKLKTFG